MNWFDYAISPFYARKGALARAHPHDAPRPPERAMECRTAVGVTRLLISKNTLRVKVQRRESVIAPSEAPD